MTDLHNGSMKAARAGAGGKESDKATTRVDVAATIVELLRTPSLNRLILEVTGGGRAISALAIGSAKDERISR